MMIMVVMMIMIMNIMIMIITVVVIMMMKVMMIIIMMMIMSSEIFRPLNSALRFDSIKNLLTSRTFIHHEEKQLHLIINK